ncbi:Putative glycolipid transfer protein [Colletotrichum destructivum]|uniref:Glycolipid transfer protein n=1 Tax=Colletotrichum destructivum TaxID=34406 RepID=A0AAX4IWM6_9PEZI|nr:Putative glycolipid transfer protein [Colletotrichum destructivum]
MSAPVSNQVDNLGKSVAVLDASVSPDGQIGSSQFLDAVDSLLQVFDIVENDPLEGGRNSCEENVSKIRNAMQSLPGQAAYVQTLIQAERASGQHEATEALLWLTRGLEFYVASVRRIANNTSEKLSASIVDAYKDTLKKHHGFVAKTAIKVAVSKTCPTRDALLRKLGQDPTMVVNALQASATSFERVLHVLAPFLARSDIKF